MGRPLNTLILLTLGLVIEATGQSQCQTTRLYVQPRGTRGIAAGEKVVYSGSLYEAATAMGDGSLPPASNTGFRKIEDCPVEFKNGRYADCAGTQEASSSSTPPGASRYAGILGPAYTFKFNCITGGASAPTELADCQIEGICTPTVGGGGSGSGTGSTGADCSQALDLPQGATVKKGTYVTPDKHLFTLSTETWAPTATSQGVKDLGPCSDDSLKKRALGWADCSSSVVSAGTSAGNFLVTAADGTSHRVDCNVAVWQPSVTTYGCVDLGICTQASLIRKPAAPVAGQATVAGGQVAAPQKPQDCKKIEQYQPGSYVQKDQLRVVDGIVYSSVDGSSLSPKAGPQQWRTLGQCTKDYPLGRTTDCSTFVTYDPSASYAPGNRKGFGVKYHKIGYLVAYESANSSPPGSDTAPQFQVVGACSEGTADSEPTFDCSTALRYQTGAVYQPQKRQFTTKAGKTIDLSSIKVQAEGRLYSQRGSYANSKPEPKSGEWDYVGLCTNATANLDAVVNCSEATLMKPGRLVPKPQTLLYTANHHLYSTFQYYVHPETDIADVAGGLMPIGVCLEGTEKGIVRSATLVDCKLHAKWNPRTVYFKDFRDTNGVKLETDGNLYQLKAEYAAYTAPDLSENLFNLIGTCLPDTTGYHETGPNDYTVDQELTLRVCCPQDDCAGYIGIVQCLKKDKFVQNYGVGFCPLVQPQSQKSFVDDHWKGSFFDRRNISRNCEEMVDSQVMDFYPGTVFPSPGNWPSKVVVPYFDAGMAQFPPLEKMVAEEKSGLKLQHFFAAFVQTNMFSERCEGAWASAFAVEVGPRGWGDKAGGVPTYYYDVLNRIRQNGGDWAVSFGGYNGVEIADSDNCQGETRQETVQKIKTAYKNVIDATKVTHINFDIEGGSIQALSNKDTHWEDRADALLLLMKEMPNLKISHTFPVLPTGLADDGIAYVDMLMRKGVRNDYILAMTMDYGDAVCPTAPGQKTMFDCEKSAMEGLAKQVFDLATAHGRNPGWKSAEDVYPILGSIPMIGQNDVVDEIYTFADAKRAVQWYSEVNLGVSSYWAVTRDRSALDKKTLPDVPQVKAMLKAIALGTPPKKKGKKGFAESTGDGVTPKGQQFIFTNIFIDHYKSPLTKQAITPLF